MRVFPYNLPDHLYPYLSQPSSCPASMQCEEAICYLFLLEELIFYFKPSEHFLQTPVDPRGDLPVEIISKELFRITLSQAKQG